MVGSRQGADLGQVELFLRELSTLHPETVIVSGGAEGVDTTAEQTWLSLGGRVKSYRPVRLPDFNGLEQYGTQLWSLGGDRPSAHVLIHEPSWGDYKSALFYRNMLIAEECTRMAAFHRRGLSRGTSHAEGCAEAQGRPVFRFEAQG